MGRDLRQWLKDVEGLGELRAVRGAHWDLEIGVITEIWGANREALLFDEIPGYPPGYRVLAHSLSSPGRIALTLGLSPSLDRLHLVSEIRKILARAVAVPPVTVRSGAVQEVQQQGEDVNLLAFPTPKWHELDGGRYIGTGCVVVQRDPETGWVNLGTYRLMIHDRRTTGILIAPGKHGMLIRDKYWAAGKPCPVAVSLGHDPLLFLLGGIEIPYGVGEYDWAGGILGHPIEVLEAPLTGLPVPADSEIVLEGEMPPGEERMEGPFAEWTGYYAAGARPEPVVHVRSLMHRRDPILLGAPPGMPPSDDCYYNSYVKSAGIWDELEKAGVPGVTGVWCHEAGGGRLFVTVAIRQLYPGHAKQAGAVAAQCHQGAYANRFVIVVDEDIDPSNLDEVVWALSTRVEPERDMDLIRRSWTSPVDPMHQPPPPESRKVFTARVVIDACRPWERRDDFPPTARPSPEMRRQILEKWSALFGR
ncbi:MAG: UbiD family decarboxylase [Deltaproteobacteria bacterium]|nr:UbiD family decarboxylase [Deltaproteobacteria bacterium]MBI3076222.1 UbiD family decarboxylase [Deltaproteobacteria bacterium]